MAEEKRYNGWANYATWRVNLEIFDGFDPEGQWQDAESVESLVEECVLERASGLAADYARAFLSDVDWQEIADHINEAYDLADPDAEEDTDASDDTTTGGA